VYAQAKAKNVGATVGHVNVADIKNFSVLIPPLEEQQNFAAFVHQVDAAKAAGRGEIAALETLRGKMMQEFFG
ncbi:MAG: restriction endonuclease subunit S, partial [Selenomonas sp.]|uniref:restriction endonuclease subunit S n=1 Tax=Selenomonas sp. TaxID=2053611 RepID=UPI0025D1244D